MQPPLQTPSGLKIGRLYQPAQRVVMSDDALHLQRALLGKPAPAFARSTVAHLRTLAGGMLALCVGVWLVAFVLGERL